VWIHRIDLEELEAHLERLMGAVRGAQQRRNALACSLKTLTRLDLLASLAAHFEAQTAAPAPEKSVGKKFA